MKMSRNRIDNHSQLHYLFFMIHCVCNNINTAKVDHAAACGAKTARCVQSHCGTNFNCGICKSSIEDRLALLRIEETVLEAAE